MTLLFTQMKIPGTQHYKPAYITSSPSLDNEEGRINLCYLIWRLKMRMQQCYFVSERWDQCNDLLYTTSSKYITDALKKLSMSNIASARTQCLVTAIYYLKMQEEQIEQRLS